jgi:hypothetical protein
MELKKNWQLAAKSVIVVFLLFVTSINIDLGGMVINIHSLREVMKYNQEWIFIGSDKEFNLLISKELKELQNQIKLKNERSTSKEN